MTARLRHLAARIVGAWRGWPVVEITGLAVAGMAWWLAAQTGAWAGTGVFLAGLVVTVAVTRAGRRPAAPKATACRGGDRQGLAWPERGVWPPPWARIRQLPDTADELIRAWVEIPSPRENRQEKR